MVAKQVQIRRDSAANLAGVTPAAGELGFDLTNERIVAGNGVDAGGIPHANYRDVRNQTFSVPTVGGTANAITLTFAPEVEAYETDFRATFKPSANNTGPVTLNVDGKGARNLYKLGSGALTALEADDLVAGVYYEAIYDGTQFQLTGNGGGSSGQVNVIVFTSSGTYTPSAGMKSCIVEALGAGGGGASGSTTDLSDRNGNAGGNTSLGTLLVAASGLGGVRTSIGGSAGGLNSGGTGGQLALSPKPGIARGASGDSYYGWGAFAQTSDNSAGLQGTDYGVGGSGGRSSSGQGGPGGSGQYRRGKFTATEIGASQTVTIGSGGSGSSQTPAGGAGRPGILIITEYF